MNVAAVADEGEIVCSFIFKNAWAMENLDKICGQQALLTLRRSYFHQPQTIIFRDQIC